jgi:CPA1 family monovalent cation:H+ antiporter
MQAVTICLTLIALACGASLLGRVIRLPLPFLQIGVGVLAAAKPFGMEVSLDPHMFFLLFIPPLLFGDGWGLPRRALAALRWPTLGHAVGLVLMTVVVAGYGLHWLIPSMPLSVAFAVAALVSPTDAVAVSAITEGIRLPRRLRHLLEAEALLNDATGLVAMRLAVAATLSGAFSLPQAALSFVLVGCGGLAVGWSMTVLYDWLHRRLLLRAQDAALQTVLSGLLPFAAYGVAETLDVSGILAAVAAGMAASRVSLLERAHFSSRLQSGYTWDVLTFCLNGVIFVLLGLQLPGIVGSGPNGINLLTSAARWKVLGAVAALTALLIVLRLIWVLVSVALSRMLRQPQGRVGWRVIAAASIAGVRGAVTLAGVLSLPLLLPDGAHFPSRDLAITLATGVILCSMLVAAVGLPVLLRDVRQDGQAAAEEARAARIAAAEAAMRAVSAGDGGADARAAALLAFYRERLDGLRAGVTADETGEDGAWRDLHRTALHAERAAVQRLRATQHIDDPVAREVLGELDLLEAALMQRPFSVR